MERRKKKHRCNIRYRRIGNKFCMICLRLSEPITVRCSALFHTEIRFDSGCWFFFGLRREVQNGPSRSHYGQNHLFLDNTKSDKRPRSLMLHTHSLLLFFIHHRNKRAKKKITSHSFLCYAYASYSTAAAVRVHSFSIRFIFILIAFLCAGHYQWLHKLTIMECLKLCRWFLTQFENRFSAKIAGSLLFIESFHFYQNKNEICP